MQGALCTGSGRFKHIEPHRTLHPHRDSKVYRLLSHEFGVVRLYRTSSDYISSGDTRCAGCNMQRFGEVQAHRTSLNLLELHPHRDNNLYRVILNKFGVARLYRTFSIYIVIGETRCAGYLCTSSGWFKHIEPLLNLLELHLHRDNKVYRVILNGFGVVRLYRTFSDYIFTGDRRSAGCIMHRFREVQAH